MHSRLPTFAAVILGAALLVLTACTGRDRAQIDVVTESASAPTSLTPVTAAAGAVEVARPTPWGSELPRGAVAVPMVRPIPIRLRIEAIGVDAPVVAVGVTGAGALDLPHEAATVAWFQHGAAPGESGSAVLAGHVDYDGDPGALFDLRDMPRGARIDVHFNDGTIRTFVTHATAVSYPKSSLPLDVLFRRGESPVLTLVTCGGTFDRRTRSYADNVTVVAVPARSAPS